MISSRFRSMAVVVLLLALGAGVAYWATHPRPAEPVVSAEAEREDAPEPPAAPVAKEEPKPAPSPPEPAPAAPKPIVPLPTFMSRNTLKANVGRIARFLETGDAASAEAWSKALAKELDEDRIGLDDLMSLFSKRRPQAAKPDLAFGISPKPIPGVLDGIEAVILSFDDRTRPKIPREYLLEMAYWTLAVAEVLKQARHSSYNRSIGSDWTELCDEFKAAAGQLVASVRDTKPLPVRRAVERLGNTCLNCHEIVKGNSPPVELWQRKKSTKEILAILKGGMGTRFSLRDCQLAAFKILRKRKADKETSVPAILSALQTVDEELAETAAEALRALGETDKTGEAALDNALQGEPIRVRFGVAWQARLLKSPTSACAQWLTRPLPEERLKAVNWLALLGDRANDTAPQLQKIHKDDPDADVRLAAGEALRKISKKALFPALLEGLKDSDALVRGRAAQALVKSGAAAVPTLRTALAEKDRDVRASAIGALGRIGPPAKDAAGDLRALLKAEDALVRKLAADALGQIEGKAP